MTDWERAWFDGGKMPTDKFPSELKDLAQTISEHFSLHPGALAMLQVFVSQMQAAFPQLPHVGWRRDCILEQTRQLMSDLLWNGFRLSSQDSGKHCPPVPVLIKMFKSPPPFSITQIELERRLQALFQMTLVEWTDQYRKYGDKLKSGA